MSETNFFVHPSSYIDEGVAIGENTNYFPDSCAGYVTKWVKHLIENNSTRHVTHTILT